jgi:hypothetical protein
MSIDLDGSGRSPFVLVVVVFREEEEWNEWPLIFSHFVESTLAAVIKNVTGRNYESKRVLDAGYCVSHLHTTYDTVGIMTLTSPASSH